MDSTSLLISKDGCGYGAGEGCSGASPLPFCAAGNSILNFFKDELSSEFTKQWGFFVIKIYFYLYKDGTPLVHLHGSLFFSAVLAAIATLLA